MRALLLHNPSAGSGQPSPRALMALLRRAGLAPTYVSSKDPDYQKRLQRPTDLMIVAGGDGTVAKAILAVSHRHLPLAVLPLGTANNIACALGIEGKPKDVVATWERAKARRFDIGKAKGPWGVRPFVESVGLGSLARSMGRVDDKSHEPADKIAAGRAALRRALSKDRPLKRALIVDGHEVDGAFLLVEVLNVGYVGPGLPLVSWADPGDGLLDVICVEKSRRAEMLEWIDKPDGLPPVTLRRGRKVEFAWDGTPLRFDDELCDTKEKGTVKVRLKRKGVMVLAP
jgi:diacylglycerol kinase (ATP)